ncbi:hypothetical protein EVAR_79096_1 [Eumeta japonica]|uniref:Uncharacterized protein n=1 Tax=Eumeta variegata TaxID=151549 RepID=A0A4C1X1K9_EUMVA|nr:hypothetical protein EVAR_79096_1 [Eumeta japonica]
MAFFDHPSFASAGREASNGGKAASCEHVAMAPVANAPPAPLRVILPRRCPLTDATLPFPAPAMSVVAKRRCRTGALQNIPIIVALTQKYFYRRDKLQEKVTTLFIASLAYFAVMIVSLRQELSTWITQREETAEENFRKARQGTWSSPWRPPVLSWDAAARPPTAARRTPHARRQMFTNRMNRLRVPVARETPSGNRLRRRRGRRGPRGTAAVLGCLITASDADVLGYCVGPHGREL